MCRNNHDSDGDCLCVGEEALQRLIGQVETIHPEAAEWLRSEECRRVMQVSKADGSYHGVPCGHLSRLLVWKLTPQGHSFWHDLNLAVRRLNLGKEL